MRTRTQPFIPPQLLSSRPFPVVKTQHPAQKIGQLWRQLRRQSEITLDHLPKESLFGVALKGKASHHHPVQDYAQRPNICGLAEIPLTFDDLRSNVVRGSANCMLPIPLVLQLGRQPEISQLQLRAAINRR